MQQQWRRSGKRKRQDETQFPTKIGGKTSLGPIYLVLYNCSYTFDVLLCQNQLFSSPNRMTLQITLIPIHKRVDNQYLASSSGPQQIDKDKGFCHATFEFSPLLCHRPCEVKWGSVSKSCLLSQSEPTIAPEPQGGGFHVLLLIYNTFAKAWEYLSSTKHQNRVGMKECTPGYFAVRFNKQTFA